MKLQEDLRFKIEASLDIYSIHDDDPIAAELKEIFGDNAFFLDENGLSIVLPVEPDTSGAGNLVKVASWVDNRNTLSIHEPEILAVIFDLLSNKYAVSIH